MLSAAPLIVNEIVAARARRERRACVASGATCMWCARLHVANGIGRASRRGRPKYATDPRGCHLLLPAHAPSCRVARRGGVPLIRSPLPRCSPRRRPVRSQRPRCSPRRPLPPRRKIRALTNACMKHERTATKRGRTQPAIAQKSLRRRRENARMLRNSKRNEKTCTRRRSQGAHISRRSV